MHQSDDARVTVVKAFGSTPHASCRLILRWSAARGSLDMERASDAHIVHRIRDVSLSVQ